MNSGHQRALRAVASVAQGANWQAKATQHSLSRQSFHLYRSGQGTLAAARSCYRSDANRQEISMQERNEHEARENMKKRLRIVAGTDFRPPAKEDRAPPILRNAFGERIICGKDAIKEDNHRPG